MEEREENNEEIVYTLSELAESYVDKNIETMDEWLTLLNEEELARFHRMCNKDPNTRTDKENYEIGKYALILYCRELGLNELAITDQLIVDITGTFSANVIIESLRRKNYAITDGPLLIYKDVKVKLTKEGKEFLKEHENKNEDEE